MFARNGLLIGDDRGKRTDRVAERVKIGRRKGQLVGGRWRNEGQWWWFVCVCGQRAGGFVGGSCALTTGGCFAVDIKV